MERSEKSEETPEMIYMRREDERFRLVVSRSGDYAEIHVRDSHTGVAYTIGAAKGGDTYRVDEPWGKAYGFSWEELAAAFARERRVVGTVAVAYPATGTVARFEV